MRHRRHCALHHQLGTLGKRIEAHVGGQAGSHLVDQLRLDAHLQHQRLVAGRHIEQLLARRNHRANALHNQTDHLAIGRRADFGTRQLFAGGQHPGPVGLDQSGHVRQLGFDLLARLLLARHHALTDFGNGLLSPHDLAARVGLRRRAVGRLAIEFQQAILGHITVGHQRRGARQLFAQQRQLLLATVQHRIAGLNRRLLATDAFLHAAQLGGQSTATRAQQTVLGLYLTQHGRVGFLRVEQLLAVRDACCARLLGAQPGLRRQLAQVLLAHLLVVGQRGAGVQLEQRLSFLDPLAFAHHHLGDDATELVLHRLALGVDRDLALRRHALVERCQRGPQQKAAEPDRDHPQADLGRTPGFAATFHRIDIGHVVECGQIVC